MNNREIKFRGLRVDGRGWVYGFYVYRPDGAHLIYWQPFLEATQNTYHEVDPKTIGQYTGLKDKNGVEIYESDVLSVCHDNIKGYKDNAVVEFHDCNFCLRQPGDTMFNFWLGSRHLCNIEVIGNIHQDSSLLEQT